MLVCLLKHYAKLKVFVNVTVNFLELSSVVPRFHELRFRMIKEFQQKAIHFYGTFHGLKITNCTFILPYCRLTGTNNYGSCNSIKGLAFFETSSQWWSFITKVHDFISTILLFCSDTRGTLKLNRSFNTRIGHGKRWS